MCFRRKELEFVDEVKNPDSTKTVFYFIINGGAVIFQETQDAWFKKIKPALDLSTADFLVYKYQPEMYSYKVDGLPEAINRILKERGLNREGVDLVISGKSLGGPIAYNLMRRKIGFLEKFKTVSIITVDAHSLPPADGGYKHDKWYGPVRCIKNEKCKDLSGYYDLAYLEKWLYLRDLFWYNIYQRRSPIKGYAFSALSRNNIFLNDEDIAHQNISRHKETIALFLKAFNKIL
ncbi:MAG: hypothetical protein GF311_28185 [Candidatus Lokiarchaeota archaeon]|nr:hypothetical protein [Candidatus Lokiarchaeota archaeon]